MRSYDASRFPFFPIPRDDYENNLPEIAQLVVVQDNGQPFIDASSTPPAASESEDPSDVVSHTHLRAHETVLDLVCRLLLENKYVLYNIHLLSHSSTSSLETMLHLHLTVCSYAAPSFSTSLRIYCHP